MAFCSKCGTQLGEGMVFCGACGERRIEAQAEPQVSQTQPQRPIVMNNPLAQRALAAGQEIQRMGDAYEKAMAKYEAFAKTPQSWKERTWQSLMKETAPAAIRSDPLGALLSTLAIVGFIFGIVFALHPAVPLVLRILGPLVGIALLVLYILTYGMTNSGLPNTFKVKKALQEGVLTQEEYNWIWPWSDKGLGKIYNYYHSDFLPVFKEFERYCRGPATQEERTILESLSVLDDFVFVFYLRKATKEMKEERAAKLAKVWLVTVGAAFAFALPITAITLGVMAPSFKTTFTDGSVEYNHSPGNIL